MTVQNGNWTPIGNNDGYLIQWGPLQQGDTAVPITEVSNVSGFADRSVQVEGTFGSGGQVAFAGSNDGVNFEVLNDPSGTPLLFTAARIRAVLEATRQIMPILSGGDGTTALTVSLFARKLR
jgi:hypothetical protein